MSDTVATHRKSKKELIQEFFAGNVRKKFASPMLHAKFGSAVRTRISDINLDTKSPIVIKNATSWDPESEQEVSSYWAEERPKLIGRGIAQGALF